jgi:hypothetical protein
MKRFNAKLQSAAGIRNRQSGSAIRRIPHSAFCIPHSTFVWVSF